MDIESGAREQLDAVAFLALERDDLRARLANTETGLDAACIAAREAGATWDEIAARVGMSRQAVQKRIAAR